MQNKEDEIGKKIMKINKVDRERVFCGRRDMQVARELEIIFDDDGFNAKDSSL